MADVPGSPAAGSHDSGGEQSPHSNSNFREQDRFLPIANISRIMKKALPANGKIAKDAKDTVQECVSEFISFVTSEASDKCQKEKRKTINGDDLLWAMATLGFEDYIEPLKVYLSRYRECFKTRVEALFMWVFGIAYVLKELIPLYQLLSFLNLFSNMNFLFSSFFLTLDAVMEYRSTQLEGDTKGSARGDVSGKKDTVGSQIVPNAQQCQRIRSVFVRVGLNEIPAMVVRDVVGSKVERANRRVKKTTRAQTEVRVLRGHFCGSRILSKKIIEAAQSLV
ncbi:hypothetical protein R6Q57_027132 [Mikania cordata]